MNPAFERDLLDAAATPFKKAGRFAYHFARGKLGRDPIFVAILERGLVPDNARIVDLGCGQGVLPAWLLAARALYEAGRWIPEWPVPPRVASVRGVELMPREVEWARKAWGSRVAFEGGDIRTAELTEADLVAILDVLHYIDYEAQEKVLRRVWDALAPGGRLLTRFGDAAGGWSFRITRWVDCAVAFFRGRGVPRLYFRRLSEWTGLLEGMGFRVQTLPMCSGTPFSNVMVLADRPRTLAPEDEGNP